MCVCQPDTATEAGVESHLEAVRHRILNGIRDERRQDVCSRSAGHQQILGNTRRCGDSDFV